MSVPKTKYGTFDELVAGLDPKVECIARQLRALIFDNDPRAVEVVRRGDQAASYGIGPKKMSEAYVYIIPKVGYVNLGFYHGVALTDPSGLLEGTGTRLRHVKVRSLESVTEPALLLLIQTALIERRKVLGYS